MPDYYITFDIYQQFCILCYNINMKFIINKKFMRYIFLVLALPLILAGCLKTPVSNNSNSPIDVRNVNEKAENGEAPIIDNSKPGAVKPAEDQAIVIDMIAKNWEFQPATVTVSEGDVVRLNINSIDVDHGISLLDFNVSEKLESGQTTSLEFVADRKGSFTFFCNVYCGSGHKEMKGILIVE
jgi:heme/copper-type cytochrome/quinol oxidase subunit 2